MAESTVVLVDDHRLVRAGLKTLIDNIDGFTVIAEGSDGAEALQLVNQHSPDVLLLDISMRDMSGLDALAQLKGQSDQTRIIMLSMHDSPEYVIKSLQGGANGYLLKDSAESELELALGYVMEDQLFLSPRVSRDVVMPAITGRSIAPHQDDVPLTPRQREILRLIADGKATKEIAWELGVSAKTVESHRAQIMERLQIRDIAGLIRYAFRHGLSDL
ncbi:MAG: response regulator transcription factor [Marinobacter sp.]|nr:response regulator transcription factor [Marinobacter sp.]